ncbi:ribosome maturation factor RimP [Spirochaetia bacterium]|nr:ribosome maturation factor RimP [Spirochaetia bacterium]
MRFTPKTAGSGGAAGSLDPGPMLLDSLEPVARGMGLSLVELTLSRHKGRGSAGARVQIRVVVYKKGIVGIDDCSAFHRSIIPRLELAFPGQDLYVEVSSPGIDRLIKDGAEFAHYVGRGVRCYRTDISDWSAGILETADEAGIVLGAKEEKIRIPYDLIAKARLDSQAEQQDPGGKVL